MTKSREGDLDWRIELARLALTADSADGFLDVSALGDRPNSALLFAYVRAFIKLASLGNVDEAAAELQTTRPSVTRHVQMLEESLNCRLFESIGTVSKLTPRGALYHARLCEFYQLGSEVLTKRNQPATRYTSVTLPLRYLSEEMGAPKLLRDFSRAWFAGRKTLDCPQLNSFRPYWIVYERRAGIWHSREIGDRCSLSCWYGVDLVRDSIGSSVPEMISGMEFKDEVSFALDAIYLRGGLHYSEVSLNLPRPGHEGLVHVQYHRLYAEIVDDKGNAVVASLIDAPHMQPSPMREADVT